MKSAGGIVLQAINATGAPTSFPIPRNGFNTALVGAPADYRKYKEAHDALLGKWNKAGQPLPFSAAASFSPALPPAAKVALKQPTTTGGWVKLCENAAVKDKDGKNERALRICLTHYERLDSRGLLPMSAAVQQVEGSDKQRLMVMVALGVLQSPGLKAALYPREAWNKLLNGEAIEDSRFDKLSLSFTTCHAGGCVADMEATPQLLNQIRTAGGMMVTATAPGGQPMAYPVPFAGFGEAYAGAPVDNAKYVADRKALMERISKARQK